MNPKVIAAHQSDPNLKVPDPYRMFFPLGILIGLVGVSVWPMLAMGWISYPNPLWHIDLLLQGFLFAFILGFLLTALPRFSRTSPITTFELGFFLIFFVAGNLATFMNIFSIGRICFWINLTFLLIFAIRRFLRRQANPPPEFVFVGVGLLLGWIAAWIRFDTWMPWPLGISELVGRRLISEGMVLMLVLGVAGKLVPMFFGFSKANPLVALGNAASVRGKLLFNGGIVFALLVSFLMEHALGWIQVALYLRAGVASFVFFATMKIHRKPLEKGMLVQVMRWSNWAVWLALWGAAIHPQYRVEVLHVLFIGGFGMMILGIATRVIVSHGNYPAEYEKNSFALGVAGWILFAALMVRSVSSLMGEKYFFMLGLAGSLWMLGLVLWGIFFVPKAVKILPKSMNV
jgi:uncharacterized protein involved in response to NO